MEVSSPRYVQILFGVFWDDLFGLIFDFKGLVPGANLNQISLRVSDIAGSLAPRLRGWLQYGCRSLCDGVLVLRVHFFKPVGEHLVGMAFIPEITEEDSQNGFIYVLSSLSPNPQIRRIKNLYKVGYCSGDTTDRIKNAKNEPTSSSLWSKQLICILDLPKATLYPQSLPNRAVDLFPR